MKITGINSALSTDTTVTLLVHPSLDSNTIEHVKRLSAQLPPVLKGITIGFSGSCLTLSTGSFSPEIAHAVEELLTAAAKAVQLETDAAKQKAQAITTAKQEAMEAAAKAFGVPIR